MAREWDSVCLICKEEFSFSHTTYQKLLRCGQQLPQTCSRCEAEFLRERRAMGRDCANLGDTNPEILRELAVADLEILPADVTSKAFESALEEHRDNFGVSDMRLLDWRDLR